MPHVSENSTMTCDGSSYTEREREREECRQVWEDRTLYGEVISILKTPRNLAVV